MKTSQVKHVTMVSQRERDTALKCYENASLRDCFLKHMCNQSNGGARRHGRSDVSHQEALDRIRSSTGKLLIAEVVLTGM